MSQAQTQTQTQVSAFVTASLTNAQIKAQEEQILIRESDRDLFGDEEMDNPFYDAFSLYKTINMTQVRHDVHDGAEFEEAKAEHTYHVLVDNLREIVLQSSDPHARFRLSNENSSHEDKDTGSKHEIAVATSLDYDVLPHGKRNNGIAKRLK